MRTEPVWTTAGITSGVAALIGLLVSFGLPVTEGQAAAIVGVVAVLAPVVVALASRRQVTPLSRPRDADGTPLVPVPGGGITPLPDGRV